MITARILTTVTAAVVCSAQAFAADDVDFFESRIRPLLNERCFKCHSDKLGKSKGGLKLDSRSSVMAGGDSGPALEPGNPENSLILRAVRRMDDSVSAMPPEGESLSDTQIRDLEHWITDGAVFPESGEPIVDPKAHWAFQPVKERTVPDTPGDRTTTDVDRFLLAKMKNAGLRPLEIAAPEVIARRLAFVLTGLPPTIDEIRRIQCDGESGLTAYVDSLLASTPFGERWARHWMDLVRYSDSAGHEYDYEIEGAWRYRDYLVRAFNSDLPYDVFVREHIAGDLLPPRVVDGRNEALLATGWWLLQESAAAPVDLANDEAERLDNQIDVMGKTFNALTIGCARCHDHKFDPIRTREYYGLFGIAAASPALRAWANGSVFDQYAAQLQVARDELDQTQTPSPPIEVPELEPGSATVLGDFVDDVPAGWQLVGHTESVTATNASRRGLQPGLWSGTLSCRLPAHIRSPQFILNNEYVDVLVAGTDSTVQVVVGNYQIIRSPIYDGLKERIDSDEYKWQRFDVGRWRGRRVHVEVFSGTVDGEHRILHTTDTDKSQFGLRAVVLTDSDSPSVPRRAEGVSPPSTSNPLMRSIEAKLPAPERFLAICELNGTDLPVHARGDANKPMSEPVPRQYLEICGTAPLSITHGCGRRELADAIASADNPLTARVVVNRVWHHVFGRGLVPTVDNFGLLGETPSHPELLDYLAYRFVHHHRWRVNGLIRELVLSRAFRTASGPAPTDDAENALLSRYPLRRLEAEAVRDAILAVSGVLDRTLGGEPIPVPHSLSGTGSDSGNNYPPSGPIDGDRRRSLYLASRRNFPCTFLDVFDKPSALNTFGRRDVSNVPTQALTLLNDPFVIQQAGYWAERIRHTDGSNPQRIEQMFLEAFARTPSPAELERALSLVGSDDAGWDDLALTLFNLKEFIYVP